MCRCITFKEMLGRPGWQRQVIYVVRSLEGTEYVGLAGTQTVGHRLSLHICDVFHRAPPSQMSRLLLDNNPGYFDWSVCVYDLAQVIEFTRQQYGCLSCAEAGLYDHFLEIEGRLPRGNAQRPCEPCQLAECVQAMR